MVLRRVSFSENNMVKMVETIELQEKSAIWYTKQDLASIRTTECCCANGPQEGEDAVPCTCKVSGGSDRQRQKDFVMGLLQQQMEHKKLGVQDPKGLFQFSRACTKHARKRAVQQAKEHEKQVREAEAIDIVDEALSVLSL